MTHSDGLKNIIVETTELSTIINDNLYYCGYPIEDLLSDGTPFESVIALLWSKSLPTAELRCALNKSLNTHLHLSADTVLALTQGIHQGIDPYSLLISRLACFKAFPVSGGAGFDAETALLAHLSALICALHRLTQHQPILEPIQDRPFHENLLYLLLGRAYTPLHAFHFNRMMILHADLELNASTFAVRINASTQADLVSNLLCGLATLRGPLHGGACERVWNMMTQLMQENSFEEQLQEMLNHHELIMGFGHRIFVRHDPRVSWIKDSLNHLDLTKSDQLRYQRSMEIESFLAHEKGLIPNIDYYSGIVYHSFGVAPDFYPLLFALSRSAGWIAHANEQRSHAHIIHPRAAYTGSFHSRS